MLASLIADAVQVLTFHRSKGLEFPIVYCPYLWNHGRGDDERKPLYFHDRAAAGARAIDVACEGQTPSSTASAMPLRRPVRICG